MITRVRLASVGVTDQDRALDFYVNKLGFQKQHDQPYGEDARWIEVIPPGAETALTLFKPYPGSTLSVGVFTGMVLATDDMRATYEALRDRGVQFTEAPTPQPWGGIQAQFVDQDNNGFVLTQDDPRTVGSAGIARVRFVSVPVGDQDRALAFYTKQLGFETRMDMSGTGMRWLVVAPSGAETGLVLFKHADGDGGSPAGAFSGLVFASDDIQTTYALLQGRGVPFTEAPTKQPWGGIQSLFTDSERNTFVLVQR